MLPSANTKPITQKALQLSTATPSADFEAVRATSTLMQTP